MITGDREYEGEAIHNKGYPLKSIQTYSVPVFNYSGNIALIYFSEYSGPESASWQIMIYLKIEEKWVLIGSDLLGMS
jgi:hypothetical protein